MEEKRSVMQTSEVKKKLPLLIIDKHGFLGSMLAKVLREEFLVVIASANPQEKHENVIHIPYHRKLPLIPDNVYSHFFVFFNGESELLDLLPVFDKKALAINAKLFFITSLIFSSQAVFQRLKKYHYQTLQTVVYGETFDNEIQEANEINFFIHQSRVYGRIEVPKEGLGKLYPILIDDLLSALTTLAFAQSRQARPIFLFPHHEYNHITVARILQKMDPLLKVDFSKKKAQKRRYFFPEDGVYFYRDYRLEDRMRKISLTRVTSRSRLQQKKIRLQLPNPQAKNMRFKMAVAIFLALFIAPLLLAFLCAFCGAWGITSAVKQAEQGKIATAESTATFAQKSFEIARLLSSSFFVPAVVAPKTYHYCLTTLQTGERVAQLEVTTFHSLLTLQQIYAQKSVDPKGDFYRSLAGIKNGLVSLQKLKAEKRLPDTVSQKIDTYAYFINVVEGTIDVWPSLLGFEGKKTYLILFQNNMELRPGGGFIGSYGILPIENGRAGKLQIQDVYDADGKLTQHVEPPYGLRRYEGVTHWYLRDSNFDPDFTVNAKQAEAFLQKETGQTVDGVLALDTTFLKNVLGAVDGVDVPDYQQKVSADTFYLQTQTHAEKDFFPGSTQKKDFLRSLTNALLLKLFDGGKIPYEKLVQSIATSAAEKHLLFSFTDSDVQNVFTVNGLSSSLRDSRVKEKETGYDYLGVVDANVGLNKANYYVKRSIRHDVHIDDLGELQETAEVQYVNKSDVTSPFGGDYKNYIQFVLPINAVVTGVHIDGKEVKTSPAVTNPAVYMKRGFIPPSGLEVDEADIDGKKRVGFFFIVPTKTTKIVGITYSISTPIDTRGTTFSYNLHLFKQAGSVDDQYQLSLAYPNAFSTISHMNGLTDVGGKLFYDINLKQDGNVTARFSRK
jgi:hypothetical protein